ncbi:unnamed protein product [Blepharisma stoltei]|uniref:Uncharacterized protein n=1 Tax=Blepharisma stoltei TaxID=1481888 RepID=A0AAU9J9V9_9CILI|nr:unnamed protein product [Blepharisma stoltei]
MGEISQNILGKTAEIESFKGLKYFGTIAQINSRALTLTLMNVKQKDSKDFFNDFLVFRVIDMKYLWIKE